MAIITILPHLTTDKLITQSKQLAAMLLRFLSVLSMSPEANIAAHSHLSDRIAVTEIFIAVAIIIYTLVPPHSCI